MEGKALGRPLELTCDGILGLPTHLLLCYPEYAGNHRAMFDLIQGRAASGTQWTTGGAGNGEWLGASLRDVLPLAGIKDNAVNVLLVGLDREPPESTSAGHCPWKTLHPDSLLAYFLNGEPFPRDHGFPVRVPVPGWVGSSHIQWLGRIFVSSQRVWTLNNTGS